MADWYAGNDMRVRLASFASSTASTTPITGSTAISYNVWDAETTASTSNKVISGTNLPYSTALTAYTGVVQTTAHSMTIGTRGFVQIVSAHSGLDGEWRVPFSVVARGAT